MAKLTTEEIIDALKEMTLLEASELVKAIEETFGVSAAAPVAAVAAAPAAAAAEEEEKTNFDVVLEGFGDNKIAVIKVVRALTSLGLKEAKEVVEGAPKAVLEGAKKEDAEAAGYAQRADRGSDLRVRPHFALWPSFSPPPRHRAVPRTPTFARADGPSRLARRTGRARDLHICERKPTRDPGRSCISHQFCVELDEYKRSLVS